MFPLPGAQNRGVRQQATPTIYADPTNPTGLASGVSPEDVALLRQGLGYDPAQAYRGYYRNFTGGGDRSSEPLSYADWVDQQKVAVFGQWSPLLDMWAAQWETDYGTPMPIDLRKQMADAMARAPKDVQDQMSAALLQARSAFRPDQNALAKVSQQLQQAEAGLAQAEKSGNPQAIDTARTNVATKKTAYEAAVAKQEAAFKKLLTDAQNILLNQSGFLATTYKNYATAHPTASQTAATQAQLEQQQYKSIQSSLYSATGKMPTDAEIRKYMGMNQIDYEQAINNLPYKYGLTQQQWNDAKGAIHAQWLQYFGKEPTDQEIHWAAGKNSQEIQDHIMQSPSHVTGWNISQYTQAKSYMDTLMQKEYGHSAPDELLRDLKGQMG